MSEIVADRRNQVYYLWWVLWRVCLHQDIFLINIKALPGYMEASTGIEPVYTDLQD